MAARRLSIIVLVFAANALCFSAARDAYAQALGIEIHNMVMPASGGLGGVSIARPQDLQSAIHGNPSTIAQFEGTQFSFSES
jgi:long-chain fatty acid transport protein